MEKDIVGSAGGNGYTDPVHIPPTGQNGREEIVGCHCEKCMPKKDMAQEIKKEAGLI